MHMIHDPSLVIHEYPTKKHGFLHNGYDTPKSSTNVHQQLPGSPDRRYGDAILRERPVSLSA